MRDSELVPDDFLPKYKGISLIFMFYTDITRYADITRYDINMDVEHDQGMALLGQSYHGASNLLRTVHDVDIPGTDIRLYYISARNQATAAGFEWDKHAVAHIIRSQAKDRGTFDDIASSLETYCNVSPSRPISTFPIHTR